MTRRAGIAAMCVLSAAVIAGCGGSGSAARSAAKPQAHFASVSTPAGVTALIATWGADYAIATADLVNSAPPKDGASTAASPENTLWTNDPTYKPSTPPQPIDAAYINNARRTERGSTTHVPALPSPALYRDLQTIEKSAAITVGYEPSTSFSFFLPSQQDAVHWQRTLSPLLPQDGSAETAFGGFLYVSWPKAASLASGGPVRSIDASLDAALGALASRYRISDITRVLGARAAHVATQQAKSANAATVASDAATDVTAISTNASSTTTTG